MASELLGRSGRAAQVDRALPWKLGAQRVALDRYDGRKGVVFVELADHGVVGVKWSTAAAQEVLGALVAEQLGVRTARLRVVGREQAEWQALRQRLPQLCEEDQYAEFTLHRWLDRPQLLIVEACLGSRPLQLEYGDTVEDVSRRCYELGLVLALDVALNNADRLPLGCLWGNEGNGLNVLLGGQDADATVWAIDHYPACPAVSDLRDAYCERLQAALASKATLGEALEHTLRFLEGASGCAVDEQGRRDLLSGVREGLYRVTTRLPPAKMAKLRAQVAEMSVGAAWDEAVAKIDESFLANVHAVIAASPVAAKPNAERVVYERISGYGALAGLLDELVDSSHDDDSRTFCFFDFDRTLTNGYAASSDLPVKQRVRGGEVTVRALERAKRAGLELFIVTARNPRPLIIHQLVASLRSPQRELAEFFLEQETQETQDVVAEQAEVCGVPVAWAANARLYATDYQKPMAIAHALDRIVAQADPPEKLRVVFVDDVFTNAHDVGARAADILRLHGRDDLARSCHVRAVWWDTFEEETGPNKSMAIVTSDNTEKGYPPHAHPLLAAFGLDLDEVHRRTKLYAELEAALQKPARKPAPRPPGKLGKPTAAQEKLAGFLFGGGKRK